MDTAGGHSAKITMRSPRSSFRQPHSCVSVSPMPVGFNGDVAGIGHDSADPPPSLQYSNVRSLGGWHVSTILLLLLGSLFPLLFTELRLSSLADTPVLLAILVTLWSAGRLVGLLVRGDQRLVQLTFWIFVYVWFGLAAVAQTASQQFPIMVEPLPAYLQTKALLAILVGLAAYELGLAARRKSRKPSRLTRRLGTRSICYRRVWFVGALGLVAVAVAVWNPGIRVLFSSRTSLTEAFLGAPSVGLRPDEVGNKTVGLLRAIFTWVPVFLGLYLMLTLRRGHRGLHTSSASRIRAVPATAFLAALLVGNVVVNNPIGNPRYRVGGILAALAIAIWPLTTPRRFRLAATSVLVALLFVFPFADLFRYDDPALTVTPLKADLLISPDFGMFSQEINAQLYVEQHGYTFGEQLAGTAFVFVPRSLWPSKPIDTGNLISRTNKINASASLWSTVFVDGGWLAVIATFFGYGWATAAFEGLYLRRSTGTYLVTAAVPLFAAFQILLLRGDLQPVVGELAIFPVLLFFATHGPRPPQEYRRPRHGTSVDLPRTM